MFEYLFLNQRINTLFGDENQRLKLSQTTSEIFAKIYSLNESSKVIG